MERDDVFVSYAHADDQVPHGAKQGWVSTMVEELSKMLYRLRGGPPRIYIDSRLATGENVDDALLTRVRACRSLLLVMSPAYQRSTWCQRELGNFVGVHRLGVSPLNAFVVETAPVDRESWHPALRALKSSRFWKSEPTHPFPRLHGYPNPSPDENSPYWVTLNELAHVIKERLMEREGAAETRPAVWLAEPTEDLDHIRDGIAATLRQCGFEPVPAAHYPREARAAYEEALRADLDRAMLFVQFLGEQAGRRPVWNQSSFVTLQALAARSAGMARGVPFMQWRPSGLNLRDIVDPEHRELVQGVPASRIEEFKQSILSTLETIRSASVTATANLRVEHKSTMPRIVVNANPVDLELAIRVRRSLVKIGAEVDLAAPPQAIHTPREVRLAHEKLLSECHGVVLVYGKSEPAWVKSQFAFTRKLLDVRRRGVWGALLSGPPEDKPDVDVMSPNVVLLDCRAGVNQRLLKTFVSALHA